MKPAPNEEGRLTDGLLSFSHHSMQISESQVCRAIGRRCDVQNRARECEVVFRRDLEVARVTLDDQHLFSEALDHTCIIGRADEINFLVGLAQECRVEDLRSLHSEEILA